MSNEKEFPTMPDWSKYPEKWQYFAIDCGGYGVLYTHEPEKIGRGFEQQIGTAYFEIGGGFDDTNWDTSLQKRPESQPEKYTGLW